MHHKALRSKLKSQKDKIKAISSIKKLFKLSRSIVFQKFIIKIFIIAHDRNVLVETTSEFVVSLDKSIAETLNSPLAYWRNLALTNLMAKISWGVSGTWILSSAFWPLLQSQFRFIFKLPSRSLRVWISEFFFSACCLSKWCSDIFVCNSDVNVLF